MRSSTLAALCLAIAIWAECTDRGSCPPSRPAATSSFTQPASPAPIVGKTYVGTVSLLVVVSDRGFVCSSEVIHGIDKKLDADAVKELRHWQFEPAQKNGGAVPVAIQVDVNYWRGQDGQVFMLPSKSGETTSAVPEAARPLYTELRDKLGQAAKAYPFDPKRARPLVAPELFLAGSGYGPAAPDSQRWKDLLATLDAFQALGMNAVSVMMAAPDLTRRDPAPLIAFYQRLAQEIHRRHMKLYVEHFVAPPFSPNAFKDLQNTPQGKKDFLDLMERELALIYREIKPDYLSLVTEPETTMVRWTHLSFSPDELANWAGAVATRLKSTGGTTLLGAGAGTWESPEFPLKFAAQRSLDYLDVHFFALVLSGEDQLARLADAVHKVRAARPGMPVTIGETWLYKHGANEPNGMLSREAYFRDNFSLWAPLDQQFLRLLLGVAQKEKIAVVAPYFSQYFFTYYVFGDEEANRLPLWPASVPVSWEKALDAVRKHQLSATGEAMREILATSPGR